ncbi:daunorubicin resistance ABC transporter ATPase subunit [Thermobaculum terrenum ATCC BAA-798]|uniref:Daunorubicin resistance ABC transporter ATPase subunit n=1 Tax=Thermobaculum terrenum (strain ATCC BAA-798 / CCMEE 7001 / YNP1) TaxID=525904 RepID=D1CB72_THET1|nr:daunorubicin resistance protein DrrA family ABC transporter ATP-binding protein [Thermobaculum terrenum]ACZ42037.1 daunorubicin resistance ABC transporter ATPase subunit [Thermobaculum terrenum ATCC BAA-798]
MEAIVAEHLKKTYRNGVQAIKGVSFYVKQGEIFGLLGPNGAGKSTTVRILATLTKPDSGKALVAGHDVVLEPQRVRSKIGYVAQSSGVDKYATGRENLMLQGHLQRVPKSQLKHRVNELLEWVGLSEAADRLVQTYSGGMKRRLDIAMGLVHNPSVLFLDEPTTGLDPETRSALWQDLLRLKREQNISVLLTTHYLDEADYLCDRLAIVDHGVVVAEGSPSDLKAGIRGDRVTLEVDGHVDEANERLKLLPQVIDVIVTDDALVARVENGATAIPAIITALEGSGISVRSVALSRPSLDDVYLYHTGHRFVAEGSLEDVA